MAGHQSWMIVLVLLTVLFYGVMVTFNAFAGIGVEPIFKNSTGDISDKYFLEITPAGWTFSIWSAIYVWLALMILYCLTTLCRTNKLGYVYTRPKVLTPPFYVSLILNFCLNPAWLLLWDREYVPWATVALCLMCFTQYICLGVSHANLYQHLAVMLKSQKFDVWAIRFLVHNGIAIYATWCTIAALLNVATTLIYWFDLTQELACTIVLSILAGEVVIWWFLETVVLDKYFRHTLTIWPTVIWALAGSLEQNWDLTKQTGIYTFVLIIVAACIFVFRIGLYFWRVCNYPLRGKDADLKLVEHEMQNISSK